MTKEQKICDILAREYPEVYADIEKQVGEVKSDDEIYGGWGTMNDYKD